MFKLMLILLLGLFPLSLYAQDKNPDPAKLVEQLGSASFSEREQAEKQIDLLGPKALPALKLALEGSDEEIKERARELIKRIESRADTAAALTPPKFNFKCNGTLADAVRELSNKSGVRIMLARDPGSISTRRVNIEMADASFWKVYDQICSQAKVSSRPAMWDPTIVSDESNPNMPAGVIRRGGGINTTSMRMDEILVLQDGEGMKAPHADLGLIRVRALMEPRAKESDPVKWRFELLGEPQVNWLTPPKLIFTQPADSKEFAEVSTPVVQENPNDPNFRMMEMQRRQMESMRYSEDYNDGRTGLRLRNLVRQEVPITVKWPEGLKATDIQGRIQARLELPMRNVFTVNNPDLEKDGKLASDKETTISLKSGSRKFDGSYDLSFEVETKVNNDMQNNLSTTRQLSVFGQSVKEFRIYDLKGREYELQNRGISSTSNGTRMTRTLGYYAKPPEADSTPAKLEFWTPGRAEIDVPFVIKGVKRPE